MTRIVTTDRNAFITLIRDMLPAVRAAAVGYMEAFRNELTPYPPASEANQPKARGRWYERGYGTRWKRRDGSLGGRKTSQTLGRSWQAAPTPAGAHLWSRATYSGAVHRAVTDPGTPKQASFHARRGWIDTSQAYEALERRRTWPRLIIAACRKALS